MSQNKTQPTDSDVDAFLAQVQADRRREDGYRLNQLFKDVTGWEPQMWGPTRIGFGSDHYRYESGREGNALAIGFSPRKANQVLHIMPGYQDFGEILYRLGKHKLGKACLYIKKLDDVDLDVVAEIIRAGLDDLGMHLDITPS